MLIEGDVEVPEITQRQVWNAVTTLKRNSYRPSKHTLLELERSHRTSHSSYHSSVEFIVINSLMARFLEERANINPLPKVNFPKVDSDYRGVNVTKQKLKKSLFFSI